MASGNLRLPYQKLHKLDEGLSAEGLSQRRRARAVGDGAGRRWQLRLGARRGMRWWRRRPRVNIRPLRRLLGRRARMVKTSLGKVVRRFRDGRSHLRDIFAGNYMFVQVAPAPARAYLQEKHSRAGRGLPPPPSWYCLPGVT